MIFYSKSLYIASLLFKYQNLPTLPINFLGSWILGSLKNLDSDLDYFFWIEVLPKLTNKFLPNRVIYNQSLVVFWKLMINGFETHHLSIMIHRWSLECASYIYINVFEICVWTYIVNNGYHPYIMFTTCVLKWM